MRRAFFGGHASGSAFKLPAGAAPPCRSTASFPLPLFSSPASFCVCTRTENESKPLNTFFLSSPLSAAPRSPLQCYVIFLHDCSPHVPHASSFPFVALFSSPGPLTEVL